MQQSKRTIGNNEITEKWNLHVQSIAVKWTRDESNYEPNEWDGYDLPPLPPWNGDLGPIDEGVNISLMSYVREPIISSGVSGVIYKKEGVRKEARARLVVDASGCENAVIAKQLGIIDLIPPRTFVAEYEFRTSLTSTTKN